MVPPLQVEAPLAAKPSEPRFDLAVSAAPAPQVFAALVSGTKYSMLVPQEVSGSLTLNLKSVTVKEALEAIRDLYGYEFTIKGNRILIQPNTLQTRMFKINYLASQRLGTSDMRVTSSSATQSASSTGQTGTTGGQPTTNSATSGGANTPSDSSRVTTRSDNDFWRGLNTALSALVGTDNGRAVIINPLSGVVLVKAMPSEMRAIENYLKATQLIVERQVMLEAKIVDVRLSDGFQSGINWSKFGGGDNRWSIGSVSPGATMGGTGAGDLQSASEGSTGTGTTATLLGGASRLVASALGKGFFGLAFQAKDFGAMLNFLETQGDVQVLSSPRVATLNNQKALLKVGTDDYFVTAISGNSTSTSTSGSSTTPTIPNITLTPFFSGVALDVMPQIDDDGGVILHIRPSVSVVTENTKTVDFGAAIGTFRLPLASSTVSETDSVVRVQDGNIVAIGGLMSESQNNARSGLPGASRVEGIGALFGEKSRGYSKRELVILLKPTVIQDENTWRQDLMDTQTRVQSFDPRTISVTPAK
ncbi:MAG TPA: secretin N-terminal domain-containing protein [Rhodocyclaceae bacterium]|nr:secretin N-terminal domain-containing protein [Rhodocyclaceae bacterium]